MAIPASDLVRITPRVLAGTGQDLVFNGLLLTDNARCPAKGMLTFYSPADIADYLGTDPNTIRIQAHENAKMLGFPVIVLGSRVKIPKEGFIRFCKGA